MPYQISVLDKNGIETNVNFSFKGWLGTIHERPSFKNFVKTSYESESKTKFEVSITDNRITVFSRGKIGEFDILPKVQTNRIADAYIIGEIYVDLFEDDDLSDMAISNRRGYDETDPRYVQLSLIFLTAASYRNPLIRLVPVLPRAPAPSACGSCPRRGQGRAACRYQNCSAAFPYHLQS